MHILKLLKPHFIAWARILGMLYTNEMDGMKERVRFNCKRTYSCVRARSRVQQNLPSILYVYMYIIRMYLLPHCKSSIFYLSLLYLLANSLSISSFLSAYIFKTKHQHNWIYSRVKGPSVYLYRKLTLITSQHSICVNAHLRIPTLTGNIRLKPVRIVLCHINNSIDKDEH